MALRAAKGDEAAPGEQRGADIHVCRVDTRVDVCSGAATALGAVTGGSGCVSEARPCLEPRPSGSSHGRIAAAKKLTKVAPVLVGRPFQAASRLSGRLSGVTFERAVLCLIQQPHRAGSAHIVRRRTIQFRPGPSAEVTPDAQLAIVCQRRGHH